MNVNRIHTGSPHHRIHLPACNTEQLFDGAPMRFTATCKVPLNLQSNNPQHPMLPTLPSVLCARTVLLYIYNDCITIYIYLKVSTFIIQDYHNVFNSYKKTMHCHFLSKQSFSSFLPLYGNLLKSYCYAANQQTVREKLQNWAQRTNIGPMYKRVTYYT